MYKQIKNLSEWAIILYLDKYKYSSRKEIAIFFNVFDSRVGFVLKKLIDKGIVTTKQNPKDKRSVLYYLITNLK